MRYMSMNKIQLSLWPEEEIVLKSSLAEELLGKIGRRLFTGKGMDKSSTIFNADIFNERGERIWFGDIDIYRDKAMLLRLSAKIGSLFILNAIDGMFLRYKLSLEQIRNHAVVIVEEGKLSFAREFSERTKTLIRRIKKQKENADAYRYRKYL